MDLLETKDEKATDESKPAKDIAMDMHNDNAIDTQQDLMQDLNRPLDVDQY